MRLQQRAGYGQRQGQHSRQRAPLRVRAVLATPQTEQQHHSEVASLKKCALITAVKTP